jgi:hypothetical protein
MNSLLGPTSAANQITHFRVRFSLASEWYVSKTVCAAKPWSDSLQRRKLLNTVMCRSTAEHIHPQIQETGGGEAVEFLTDKFYTVALCLGTGTKMYYIKNSLSLCTLDDQGHFCTSVGRVGRQLPNSNPAQLFSILHTVSGARPAFSRMDIGDHASALGTTRHLYVALSIRLLNGLMSSRSYT